MTKPKKRNMQDATLVNVNSLKRRVKKLEEQMLGLTAMLKFYTESFASKITLKQEKAVQPRGRK